MPQFIPGGVTTTCIRETSVLFCYAALWMADQQAPKSRVDPGLCADCIHSRRIESDRKAVFFLCQLAFSDPRFKKYPRLPVRVCEGYERQRGSLRDE
jgi:hypothetical protein